MRVFVGGHSATAYQLVTVKPAVAVGRAVPLHRAGAIQNDDVYRLEAFFESDVVVPEEEREDGVDVSPPGQLLKQLEDVAVERTDVVEGGTSPEATSSVPRTDPGTSMSKYLSQLQEFRQSSMKLAFSYIRRSSHAMGNAVKKVPLRRTTRQDGGDIVQREIVSDELQKSVSTALKEEVQKYRSRLHKYAVSMREDTLVKASRAQSTIVQYRESQPFLFSSVLVSVGVLVIAGLVRWQHVGTLKKKEQLEEAERQDRISRRKRESQMHRFTQMLSSSDQDGVDASVFNAVRQIGENASEDDAVAQEQAMTPEMEAAWKNFVRDSKLSEGEFWSQDDVFEGFKPLERDDE